MRKLHPINGESLEAMSDRLLTVPEAAKLLKMERQSIYNMQSLGKLKQCKIGKKTFCDRQEIETILRDALEG